MISSPVLFQAVLWVSVSVAVYLLAERLSKAANSTALLHPLITSAVFIFALLVLFQVDVAEYQQSAGLLSDLLGVATVALALPLYKQLTTIKKLGFTGLLPVFVGGVVAPVLAWLIVWCLSQDTALQMTMLVKSITTPLAIEVAPLTGGIAQLAAAIVIVTGVVGAVVAPWVFKICAVSNSIAKGMALGTIAHAVGTTEALKIDDTAAALATVSLCVNGITTAIVLPLLLSN